MEKRLNKFPNAKCVPKRNAHYNIQASKTQIENKMSNEREMENKKRCIKINQIKRLNGSKMVTQ